MLEEYIQADWPAPQRVQCLSTTRRGGCSRDAFAGMNLGFHVGDLADHVTQNRAELKEFVGTGVDFQWLRQIHGSQVIEADSQSCAKIPSADGIYCRQANLACCILTADCLPVCLCSSSGDEIGIAHAGWRGLATGVVENTLRRFRTTPDDIHAWLGPAIGPCHFEVGQDVRQAFANALGEEDSAPAFHPCSTGKWMADLYALTNLLLLQSGVKSISGGGFCTYCDANLFYSYRRQPLTGRFATLIRLL